jgi:hypothetical protein
MALLSLLSCFCFAVLGIKTKGHMRASALPPNCTSSPRLFSFTSSLAWSYVGFLFHIVLGL